jgi:peptide subunit release factor 1 (eRF1)
MSALRTVIDQLAAYEPSEHPVLSLFLNLQPDQHGRDNYETFLRKALKERLKGFETRSDERSSLERDIERIREYLRDIDPSIDGLAVFACDGRGLFEALPLNAPVQEHRLYIDREPHLYPLARLDDQFPRYAALLLDTNSARLFVFGAGAVERTESIQNQKTRRTQVGGWSQARYQRHADNFHLLHVKEAVDMLERVVRDEEIQHVILSGDQTVMSLVNEQLSPDVAARIVDVTKLDQKASETEVLNATLDTLRERDAESDRERVERLLDAHRAGGLAVLGPEETRNALELGQVDELLISAALDRPTAGDVASEANGQSESTSMEREAEDLVTRAVQTAAKVTFIEDHSLLGDVGGVGGFLRFKLERNGD